MFVFILYVIDLFLLLPFLRHWISFFGGLWLLFFWSDGQLNEVDAGLVRERIVPFIDNNVPVIKMKMEMKMKMDWIDFSLFLLEIPVLLLFVEKLVYLAPADSTLA